MYILSVNIRVYVNARDSKTQLGICNYVGDPKVLVSKYKAILDMSVNTHTRIRVYTDVVTSICLLSFVTSLLLSAVGGTFCIHSPYTRSSTYVHFVCIHNNTLTYDLTYAHT